MLNRSDYFFIAAALLSLILSMGFWMAGDRQTALFVGTWTPTILGFGIYLKLKHVKGPGS